VNHDALFKMLLKRPAILRAFFEAFLPDTSRFVDFHSLEFIDKERYTIEGRKRTGDLLVKTRFQNQSAGFLIHLEHQAQPDRNLGRRMLEYFVLDWRECDLPVYPIAVLSHKDPPPVRPSPVALDFPNKRVLEFDFDVIDLARLDASAYASMTNPAALALAARMKVQRHERVPLMRDFFLNLAATDLQQAEQELVIGFFSAYLHPSEQEVLQLETEMSKVSSGMAREKAIRLTNPFVELGKIKGRREGLQEGFRKGRHQGETEIVLRQLKRRLGSLSAAEETAVRSLTARKVEALGEALLEFASRTDLAAWLCRNT